MSRFLSRPSRGGLLTILNAIFWLLFFFYVETISGGSPPHWIGWFLVPPALILSLPLAIFSFLPPRDYDVIRFSIILGINSVLWGYGLSWLLSALSRNWTTRTDRRRDAGLCPSCGYDVRTQLTPMPRDPSASRCPECGQPLQSTA